MSGVKEQKSERVSVSVPIVPGLIPNRFPDLDLPEVQLTEFLFNRLDKFKDRPAVINGVTGQTYTYHELRDAICRVASALSRHGLRKGDRLLMFSKNNPEYMIAFHAAVSLGVTLSLANPTFLPNELVRQASDSEVTYVLTDGDGVDTVRKLRQEMPGIKKVFVVGNDDVISGEYVNFSELLADDGTARPVNVDIDTRKDIMALLYSSGTTGAPKGVMMNQRSTLFNIHQFMQDEIWLCKESTKLGILPLFHIFGVIATMLTALCVGQTVVTVPRFEPNLFLSTIEKFKCSMLYVVPPMLVFLSKDPMVDNYDLSRIRRIMCAAAPLKDDLAKAFSQRFPDVIIGQGYGLTETGPAVCINPIKDCKDKVGAAGVLLANTEGKFINLETREICEPYEHGELLTRGPQNMMGYLNRPDATAETIDKDGWLYTGDIGYYDEDGHVFIVDRRKELIKYKGHQVAPAELEDVLLSHPAVTDSGVTSIPDDVAGELPRGYVVLKAGESISEQELVDYVAERVGPFNKLRGGVVVIDSIPKTPSGKIMRRELKAMALNDATV